jgi:long-subunit fatty acid transport protein
MYMSDTQRFAANFALSRKLGEKWALGLGASYHLLTGATVQGRLPADGGAGNPKTSTANLKMVVKPTLAAIAGVAFNPTESQTVSFSYKGARDARVSTRFDTIIEIAGTAPMIFNTNGSIFYDPETFTFAYSLKQGAWDWNAALEYEKWDAFEGAIVKFQFDTFTSSFKQYPFDARYKNIWVPRVGFTLATTDTSFFRFGYAYKPSPTPDVNLELNFVDSDRHIIATGYDFQSKVFGLLDNPVKWGTHVQAHYLVPKDVVKSNSTDIGAPGYQIKGFVVSYGLTMTVDL